MSHPEQDVAKVAIAKHLGIKPKNASILGVAFVTNSTCGRTDAIITLSSAININYESPSDFAKRLGINPKKVSILGVALNTTTWGRTSAIVTLSLSIGHESPSDFVKRLTKKG